MELCKATLHRKQQKGEAVSQITLDDDYNVPDYRPDIVKILKEKGELRFDEVKGENGAVWLKGSLIFKVLYRNDKEEGKISSLRGEIPFQEKLNLDGVMGNEGKRGDRGCDRWRHQFQKTECARGRLVKSAGRRGSG